MKAERRRNKTVHGCFVVAISNKSSWFRFYDVEECSQAREESLGSVLRFARTNKRGFVVLVPRKLHQNDFAFPSFCGHVVEINTTNDNDGGEWECACLITFAS